MSMYNMRQGNFKIRYESEQCDWSDWAIEDCSKTCGGGQQSKFRSLLGDNQNSSNCGPQYSIEACNVQSCTEDICKELELSFTDFKVKFHLQNVTSNERPVYMDSQNVYMYSIGTGNADLDGCWLISTEIGSDVAYAVNCACKYDATPVNCNYDWERYQKDAWVLISESKINCNVFT